MVQGPVIIIINEFIESGFNTFGDDYELSKNYQ